MRSRGRPILIDSVTLSNFALAERLDLLIDRYGKRAVLTTEVLDEIYDGITTGRSGLRLIVDAVLTGKFDCTQLSGKEHKVYWELLRNLAPGEASCIACAKIRKGAVATDDRAARTCCKERSIPVTGTIGILTACCRDGQLEPTQADIVLARIIEQGFYSPVSRISDILQ